MNDPSTLLTIAVLGGTGKEGKGLAYRLAKAGYQVLIGSRSPQKAIAVASEIVEMLEGSPFVVGMSNLEASQEANIVLLTVPYSAHRETLESVKDALRGKTLIDVAVPLMPPKVTKVNMPAAGSAAQEARQILGEDTEIAAAFHNIPHEYLLQDKAIDCDVLVTGTSKETRDEAIRIVLAVGLTGWDAGPIENSVVMEGLTSVLININKRYGSTHAGIKITGVA
jgi:8-hydroxy-5-deazaflavin:NADPH oxidoreductase